MWQFAPDDVLLNILSYLPIESLLSASYVCRHWHRVASDDWLWRDCFYKQFAIDRSIPRIPGAVSWKDEYKRLHYRTPAVESEVIKQHTDEVLHVSFSHSGNLMTTCSKDGVVLVWTTQYPMTLHHMFNVTGGKAIFPQYSEFNRPDTMLLVMITPFNRFRVEEELIVLSMKDWPNILLWITSRPSFAGCWFSDSCIISCQRGRTSTDVSLWISKINSRNIEEPVSNARVIPLTGDYASPGFVVVANDLNAKLDTTNASQIKSPCGAATIPHVSDCHPDCRHWNSSNPTLFANLCSFHDGNEQSTLNIAPSVNSIASADEHDFGNIAPGDELMVRHGDVSVSLHEQPTTTHQTSLYGDSEEMSGCRLIICTTGPKHLPEQVRVIRVNARTVGSRLQKLTDIHLQYTERNDVVFDMSGVIIGMALSDDHRYLYVNILRWCDSTDTLLGRPSLSEEIDIHRIDLLSMRDDGSVHRGHKSTRLKSPPAPFIRLTVCRQYVTSGSEDNYGYLWDRHYGVFLRKLFHGGVVNHASVNPADNDMLVTVGDDFKIKIWRSRHMHTLLTKTS